MEMNPELARAMGLDAQGITPKEESVEPAPRVERVELDRDFKLERTVNGITLEIAYCDIDYYDRLLKPEEYPEGTPRSEDYSFSVHVDGGTKYGEQYHPPGNEIGMAVNKELAQVQFDALVFMAECITEPWVNDPSYPKRIMDICRQLQDMADKIKYVGTKARVVGDTHS